MKQNKEVWSIF